MSNGGGTTYTLSGTGSTPILLFPQPHTIQHHTQSVRMESTVWGIVNSGSLTYQIEITPDGTSWVPLPGFAGLTLSKVGNLAGYCYGVRLTVTSYTSGSVTLFMNWNV